MGKPLKIIDNSKHNAFPSIEKGADGKLTIGYRSSVSHLSPIAKACLLQSDDAGKTWSEEIILDNGMDFETSKYGIRGVNLSFQENMMVATYHVNDGDYGQTYFKTLKKNGKSWTKRKKIVLANKKANKISCEGKILKSNEGYLIPIFVGNKNDSLDVAVALSKNLRHWQFFPVPNQKSKEVENIIVKADNEFIMFYSDPSKSRLYRTLSTNGGRSWSNPEDITFKGWVVHRPNVYFDKKSGTMLLVYREGKYNTGAIAISNDKGRSWEKLFEINKDNRRITYADFVVLEENTLGFVYATENNLNGDDSDLFYTTITIDR